MSVKNISVVILDDHPIVLEGLKSLLAHHTTDITIHAFGNATDFGTFMEDAPSVDVILLDINLPDGNGLDICKNTKIKYPSIKIVALSNQAEQSIIRQMFENGASGFLLKSTPSDKLLSCIYDALDGQVVMDPEVMRILTTPLQHKDFPSLTKREKQLIKLLAQGKTTADIADELFLSKFTVDTYRKNLLQKFKVRNTSELLMLIVQEQLL
ncbi:response regulator [Sphingobacterium yanglingense]|uniref:LuxR family two component transcriptional regulator n=1 Tax=Sphingobacterium yanglingense TaxID=1437280 RepID=A0A4R6WGS3_9SPHI|nr:response regulator transcription factor [Sphingobacterium yanglingense]TDQ76596.1 LuxR family two component transcriptional regulator [Sphingobacterium yanglingense]